MDWTYLIAVTLPMIFLCWMWYLLNERVINNEKNLKNLFETIVSIHDRINLIEVNQKIFYELHKRQS